MSIRIMRKALSLTLTIATLAGVSSAHAYTCQAAYEKEQRQADAEFSAINRVTNIAAEQLNIASDKDDKNKFLLGCVLPAATSIGIDVFLSYKTKLTPQAKVLADTFLIMGIPLTCLAGYTTAHLVVGDRFYREQSEAFENARADYVKAAVRVNRLHDAQNIIAESYKVVNAEQTNASVIKIMINSAREAAPELPQLAKLDVETVAKSVVELDKAGHLCSNGSVMTAEDIISNIAK